MAGRHGVPSQDRKTHSRSARGQRRSRTQRRDASQPWRLWLLARVLLALVVIAASGWSGLLIQRGRGGIWPVIAIGAGVLSLVMIAWDVRARIRQRAQLRAASAVLPAPDPATRLVQRGSHQALGEVVDKPAPARPFLPEPPPRPGRHSHRR